jgi:hydroxymethylpyrimidine pyrophosphatase-like HAD family hydrolase
MFSDILLTADFDGTLTAKNGQIPRNNLEAIAYFMEHGGTFTVNTGRNLPMSIHNILGKIPMNAPFLFAEGCGVYDTAAGRLVESARLALDVKTLAAELTQNYPHIHVEIQCPEQHFLPRQSTGWIHFNQVNRCSAWECISPDAIPENVLKLVLRARFNPLSMEIGYENTSLYESTPEEDAIFAQIADDIEGRFGDAVGVFRANRWVTAIHPKGCSKLSAARKLQAQLHKKLLVCIGDGKNDISMLTGADYAFCPADGAVAASFPNVCPCADGSVADLIYNELPRILKERSNGNLL